MWRLHIVIFFISSHAFVLSCSLLHFSNYLFQCTSRLSLYLSLSLSLSLYLCLSLFISLFFFRCLYISIYLSLYLYLYIYLYICTDIRFIFSLLQARFLGPPVLNSKSYRFSHWIDSHICVVYIL